MRNWLMMYLEDKGILSSMMALEVQVNMRGGKRLLAGKVKEFANSGAASAGRWRNVKPGDDKLPNLYNALRIADAVGERVETLWELEPAERCETPWPRHEVPPDLNMMRETLEEHGYKVLTKLLWDTLEAQMKEYMEMKNERG